jgi:hypothetical protein
VIVTSFVIMNYFVKESKSSKISTSKITILAVVIATLMITSTMATVAHALPTLTVHGQGTGTFTCGDGTVLPNSFLRIDAGHPFKSKGPSQKVGGLWTVVNSEVNNGDGGFINGIFYGGKIGKSSFNLLGIFNHVEGICDNDSIPTEGIITGQCGLGATIDVRFENGAHGTFSSSVNCL